jgi:hypothetical protein
MAGFVSLSMPTFLVYFNFVSPMKWGSWVLANITFKNLVFTCTDSEKNEYGTCEFTNGNEVLDLYNFNGDTQKLHLHISILLIVIFLYFLASISVLRIKGFQISH